MSENVPSEVSNQYAHPRSLISLRCPHKETFFSLAIQNAFSEISDQTARSGFSLGSQVQRYALLRCSSYFLIYSNIIFTLNIGTL